jgi:hypothetical protein
MTARVPIPIDERKTSTMSDADTGVTPTSPSGS